MKKLPILLMLAVLAGFVAGLVHLFNLRFKTGDNFPPYSTFRSDPLGTKAFFESIDRLVPARRHLLALSKLGEGRDTTLFWLGAEPGSLRFSLDDFKKLEGFVHDGGRIVITLLPVLDSPRINRFVTLANRGRNPGAATNAPTVWPGDEVTDAQTVSFRDRWDVGIEFAALTKSEGKIVPAIARQPAEIEPSPLPPDIHVHTGLYFNKLGSDWRTLYARMDTTNQYPIMIEQTMGRGSIVLCADSYYFSNESLRRERESQLLAWFVGPAREVVFDETHLGVQEVPGVATLARQYRLEPLFFCLLILAGLFIWKNSASFMPPCEEQIIRERGEQIEGRESTAGFINLLRRHIPPGDLLKVCLEQWNAHFSHARKPSAAKLAAMQRIIDEENNRELRQRNPVETYRKLSKVLSDGAHAASSVQNPNPKPETIR